MSVTNLIDQPVDQFDEDEPLGLSKYAAALSEFIQDCETPITIGIQGDWGVGKTSLLNMVKDQLGPTRGRKADYPVIYFNTWQYAQLDQEDHLTVAMLNDIVERIRDLDSTPESAKEKAGEMLKDVGTIAMNIGNQMAKNKFGADFQKGIEEVREEDATPAFLRVMHMMVEYKKQFRELVEAFMEGKDERSRLVIMIDDLDRIRPARALDLLSSIKNFLDVPRCVFVLAVDYSVIQRGVEEKMGTNERKQHGKSYFDKIIQVPFNMPVSSYQVDRYTLSLLGWEWNQHENQYEARHESRELILGRKTVMKEKYGREIENLTRSAVGQNPRSIKRAVNYYGLLKRVFDKNGGKEKAKSRDIPSGRPWNTLYLQLLFGFSCLQLSYPEIFNYFVQEPTPERLQKLESWETLSDLRAVDEIAERVTDINDVKTDITSFFDQIVLLLDASQDDEWDVTAEEFQPVWDIIRFTNLAGGTASETENTWDRIQEMVNSHAKEAGKDGKRLKQVERALSLLERSWWGSPIHLEAKDGGKHFFNLFWDGDLVGSITSTQSDLLRFYVVAGSFESLNQQIGDETEKYVSEEGSSHHGEGTVRVHLQKLLDLKRERRFRVLRELNKTVTS